MIKFKKYLVAPLATLMCLSPVFAVDTPEDDHSTKLNYIIDQSYKWSAPADITFTTNVDRELKSGAVEVTENIIAGNETLKISIDSNAKFQIESKEHSVRKYKVFKNSDELSAGSLVLEVASGTNGATQNLDFELRGVKDGNTSQVAGTYTGTLNFVANIETAGSGNPGGSGNTGGSGSESGGSGESGSGGSATEQTYNITYELNGGTLNGNEKTSYKSSDNDYILPSPIKDGYSFGGWYETVDFSGSAITSISQGSTGDKIFYAKWEEESIKTYVLKTGLEFNALIPSTTTSIVFTDETMPANATLIDVDSDGDGGVVGWLDGTTFKVSSQKSGQKIIANEDSSYIFCGSSKNGNKTTVTQKLTNIDFTNIDTSGVTNMSWMFVGVGANATTFNLDLSGWDTSNVTNMSRMFDLAGYKATSFSLDLSGWDTSNVTDMSYMFDNTGRLNATSWSVGDLSGWDTSKVTNMSYMFNGAGSSAASWSIGDLSGWDTSEVTNMSNMFNNAGYTATTFNIDLSSWNTSKVTDMSGMFWGAGYKTTSFNLDLSNWNTSSVTNMKGMFEDAGYKATTWSIGDISGWNTSSVTDMWGMFYQAGYSATSFSLDLSGWDISSVTNTVNMFLGAGHDATSFNLDLSGWNTSSVTNMSGMFSSAGYNATSWSVGDLSGWNTSSVTNMSYMFYDAGLNATSFGLNLSGWNVNKVTSYFNFNKNVESKVTPPAWVN